MTAANRNFAGHCANTVVKDAAGTEFFATKVNQKNLVVMGLEDGRPQQGAHDLYAFVRVMNPDDLGRRFALERSWSADPSAASR